MDSIIEKWFPMALSRTGAEGDEGELRAPALGLAVEPARRVERVGSVPVGGVPVENERREHDRASSVDAVPRDDVVSAHTAIDDVRG